MNVFIPQCWNGEDFETIENLINRDNKYLVNKIENTTEQLDVRTNIDTKTKELIKNASVVVCSNRSSSNNGSSLDEIKYAININKPVVAIKLCDNSSTMLDSLEIDVIDDNKDAFENWITKNIK